MLLRFVSFRFVLCWFVLFRFQRSIQDQLALEDKQNAFVVVVSYIAMFLYISVALGKFPHPVRSRSLLGLLGIFLVISSVGSALGMCSFFGTKVGCFCDCVLALPASLPDLSVPSHGHLPTVWLTTQCTCVRGLLWG